MPDAVLMDTRDRVAHITLNRPEAMNALSPNLLSGLDAAFDQIEQSADVRAVVLGGAGRAFCAGGDLKFFRNSLASGKRALFIDFLHHAQAVFRRLETLPMPTIAAVNGVAVAGGLELVLCCDLVIAAESARVGDGHANFGIIPGGGGSIRLPRKIPVAIAKRLLFTGDLVEPAELARWGLIDRVVADADLDTAVDELVSRIIRNSPLGLRWIKQLVNDGLDQPLGPALRSEVNAMLSYADSDDIKEGLAAFSERRTPRFTGN